MFDLGFSEIILIAVVALVAVGPEDLPGILFRTGRFMRQVRMFMNGVRDQYADIMHEAEVEHYRKQFTARDLTDETDGVFPAPDILPPPEDETAKKEGQDTHD